MAHCKQTTQIGVIGAGAFGTAMAIHCAHTGHQVLLWGREAALIDTMNTKRENTTYLKGHVLPPGLTATNDLSEVAAKCELIIVAVPTPYVAVTLSQIAEQLRDASIIVSCTKGILNDTLETVNEILARVVPPRMVQRLAFLSGPSFAAEVAKAQPTLVTIGANDDAVGARVQALMSSPMFRCYRTTDVAGIELGGALKNVLAIACGISDGLGFGPNARAALITRGLSEITRLAVAKGANPLTMLGLAGIGDLVLTCTGDLSRNRTVGLRLGKGESLADITSSMNGAVAEGVLTSRSAHALAQKLKVECPIMEGIYRVVHEGADPREVLAGNMQRELGPEVHNELVAGAALAASPLKQPAGALL